MDQIFNELSAQGTYGDCYEASQSMEHLLTLSHKLSKHGFTTTLRVTKNFGQLPLTEDYTLVQWATDKGIGADRDLQRQLLICSTKAPYIDDLVEEALPKGSLIEFKYNEKQALGLGLAWLWGGVVLSLQCSEWITTDNVNIEVFRVTEDQELTEIKRVSTIATDEHLERVCAGIEQDLLGKIVSGKILVDQFYRLFPFLTCCESAEKQLLALTGTELYFREIIHHFKIINTTMKNWVNGPFKPAGITCSPESESTLNQYSSQRRFACSDGVERVFSSHSKMMSANQRIHYFAIPEQKKVFIGYVGDHLPTVKYKT